MDSNVSRKLVLDALPTPLDLDAARAAVMVVDMQNDFGSTGGMFDRSGIDISGIRRVIKPIAQVVAAARTVRIPIIYIKMGYHPDLSNLGEPGSANRERHLFHGVGQAITTPEGNAGAILVRDTWNTSVISELAPQTGDLVLYKHRYSAFFETELDALLRARGIRDLIVTGCTTSVCVESTVRDAYFRDYRVIVPRDCTAEPIGGASQINFDATMLLIETLFGWTTDSEALRRAFDSADAIADDSRLERAASF